MSDALPPATSRAARPAASGAAAWAQDDVAVGAVFAALADGTRRDVLRRLAGAGTITASELADERPMSRQAAAKHLRALADAGLVVAAREGRETRFRSVPGALDDATAWMAETGARWDVRLDRLRARFADPAADHDAGR